MMLVTSRLSVHDTLLPETNCRVPEGFCVLDTVADKQIFHKNKAARDKSRLSAKVKALATAAA
jgi:ribosomal protein S20